MTTQGNGRTQSASSILKGKKAVIFGAGGSIGAAVAREFAAEGAEVFLTGRTPGRVEALAKQIAAEGGQAHSQAVDALDESAVNAYVDRVVADTGSIDIAFNLTGPLASQYGNGKHAVDLPVDEFMVPLTTIVKSNFITAKATARHMLKQGSGAILFVTGSPARGHVGGACAIGAAFGSLETLAENLAFELSPSGVRVVCLRTTLNVDSRTIQETMEAIAAKMGVTKEEVTATMVNMNFLKRPATTLDTARTAAFLASDRARMVTATVINATAGAAMD